MAENFPFKMKWRHIAIAVLIVLGAIALRFVMLYEQAGTPNSDFYPEARDPLNYYFRAIGVMDGTYPQTAFDGMHPGVYYWFAFLMNFVGQSMVMLRMALAVVDGVAVGFMIGAGWLLMKRPLGGYLAGILYALYPPSVFYGTVLLTEGTAHVLLVLLLFVLLWQRHHSKLWHSATLGLLFGALLVTRGNLAPVSVFWVIWYWLQRDNVRDWLVNVSVAVAFSLLLVSPFTLWNYQASGEFQLVTQAPDFQTYAANNRDSNGVGGSTLAYDTVETDFWTALQRDLVLAPEHFAGLVVWRTALHWSAHEPANTINFERFRDQSITLRLFPMNFLHLSFMGLIGLASLAFVDRRLFVFFALSIFWFSLMISLTFAISRLRYPIVSLLLLLAAQGIVYWWQVLREGRLRHVWHRWLLPVGAIVALLSLSFFVVTPNPPVPVKRTYSQLPDGAVASSHFFANGELEFVGWRTFPDWWQAPDAGWMTPDDAYAVELFWRVPDGQQASQEYNFYLSYVQDGMRYGGADRPIGAVSFPERTTNRWQSGVIYGEIVSFLLEEPQPPPFEQAGQIRLGVWYWDEDGLIVPVETDSGANDIALQSFAVYPQAVAEQDLPDNSIVFGDLIALTDYRLPQTAEPAATITLEAEWRALQNVRSDYRMLLHVEDENGNVVTNGDQPPIASLPSQNWMPHHTLRAELPFTLPEQPGTYQIYGGLYDDAGRLTLDTPDNRVLLGTIEVR